jgi:hypothetical protein
MLLSDPERSENIVPNLIERTSSYDILTVEEVAQYLRKSPSWVYKHWQALGGRKIGGSLIFPGKENLYERLFSEGQGVALRLHPEGNQTHKVLVQTKTRCEKSGSRKERRNNQPSNADVIGDDPNRHGLLGSG